MVDQVAAFRNVAEVLRICQERPIWQASIQLHKYLGLP